jgi:hypothetical protein
MPGHRMWLVNGQLGVCTEIPSEMCDCRMSDLLYDLTSMKFQEPGDGEQAIRAHMAALRTKLTDRFRALEEEFR